MPQCSCFAILWPEGGVTLQAPSTASPAFHSGDTHFKMPLSRSSGGGRGVNIIINYDDAVIQLSLAGRNKKRHFSPSTKAHPSSQTFPSYTTPDVFLFTNNQGFFSASLCVGEKFRKEPEGSPPRRREAIERNGIRTLCTSRCLVCGENSSGNLPKQKRRGHYH